MPSIPVTECAVYVYRPEKVLERFERPGKLSGEPGRALGFVIAVRFIRLIAAALISEFGY